MNCETTGLKCLGKTLNMDHHNMQEEVSVRPAVCTEEVSVRPPVCTEEVSVRPPVCTEEVSVRPLVCTEQVSVRPPVCTEQVSVASPASTEKVPLTYCKISEFLRLFPIFSRATLFRQVEEGKINVRRDIQSGLPVRPYELAIYSMKTWERLIALRKSKHKINNTSTKAITVRISGETLKLVAGYAAKNGIKISQIFSKTNITIRGEELCISRKSL